MDTRSLYNQEQPQDLLSLNYNGVMGTKLFLEGQYSQRHLSFVTSGARRDRSRQRHAAHRSVPGERLPLLGARRSVSATSTSATTSRCSRRRLTSCRPVSRGAHTIVFGYDRYNDQRHGRQPSVGQRLPNSRNLDDHSRGNDLPRVPEQQLARSSSMTRSRWRARARTSAHTRCSSTTTGG